MAEGRGTNFSVMVVNTDGSVLYRQAEPTSTNGLVIVADCASCAGVKTARHVHRRWRIQTTSEYFVGDISLPSRSDAHAAAASLGSLSVAWQDPGLSVQVESDLRAAALAILARWGLTHAASLRTESIPL